MDVKVGLSCALGWLFFLSGGTAQAISLSFLPSSQTVTLGQSAQVAVQIADLGVGTAPSLGTFDFKITFNPSILFFDSNKVSFGDPILGDQLDLEGLGSDSGVISISDSMVNLFEVSFDDIDILNQFQADTFILVNLPFNLLATGTSPLTISNVILGDADGNPLTASLSDGSITMISQPSTPIPEPSSFLMSVGLLGFCCLKKQ